MSKNNQGGELNYQEDCNGTIAREKNIVAAPRLENNSDDKCEDFNFLPPDPTPSTVGISSSVNHEEDSLEDCDFLHAILRYINKMLMEEDTKENTCMVQDSLKLQATEKSFYEVLSKKYPPSPEQNVDENMESQDGSFMQNSRRFRETLF
ncbi:hypothetical protein SLE2022_075490 [Rubroshorea leprosula]